MASIGMALGLAACSDLGDPIEEPPDPDPLPVITSLDPDSGIVGDTFLVVGTDFGTTVGALTISDVPSTIVSWATTTIRAIVPAKAVSGLVRVQNAAGSSNRVSFRVIGTPDPLPELTELVPVRTVIGDTLRILGTEFGSDAGERRVVFTGAGPASVDGTILSWDNEEVIVLVPDGAVAGDVALAEGARRSNALPFAVAPEMVSFLDDLRPIFNRQGCMSCHGGQNNLWVDTPAGILRGGDHGPAAIPRRGPESLLVRVLRGPVGDIGRMPDLSPALSEAEILTIEDWVNQGARNN